MRPQVIFLFILPPCVRMVSSVHTISPDVRAKNKLINPGFAKKLHTHVHAQISSLIVWTQSSICICICALYVCVFSVKTAPPDHLKERVNKGSLCLSWEAPLSALSAHLLYQVHYDTKEGGPWLVRPDA